MGELHDARAGGPRGCWSRMLLAKMHVLPRPPAPSASAMVDRLVEKKVLTRRRSPEDRRKVVVEATSDAVDMLSLVEDKILATFVELVEIIGPEATRKWCEALERVEEAI